MWCSTCEANVHCTVFPDVASLEAPEVRSVVPVGERLLRCPVCGTTLPPEGG